jgi:hypothetical protein
MEQPARQTSAEFAVPREIVADLAYLRTLIVNVYFHGREGAEDREWVLVEVKSRKFCKCPPRSVPTPPS